MTQHGVAITDAAMAKAQKADAVMFGAVGGPKWDERSLCSTAPRPACCACARISTCSPTFALRSAIRRSPMLRALKRELVEGLDIMIVRELTGGVYFGEPKEIVTLENGEQRAVDTQVYTTHEIERIAKVAFDLARKRGNKVHSAEKHNVMRTGVLWKQVVTDVHKSYAPDVKLEHILADNCAMQLVRNPKQFDVIVTDNLFGDILSDEAAMVTGSLGMLPSASLGAPDPKTGQPQGALRARARLGARYRRQGPRQSDRDDCLVRHGAALFLRHGRRKPTASTRRSPASWTRACAPATSCSRA